jgi:hypothetical protein
MGKIGARQDGGFKAVSTAPSFNKTPVGNSIPPLPYPTTQDLGNSASPAKSVRFNGDPAYVINKTTQPAGTGDGPGTAKGIRSGTVTGEVKPTGAASHFRAEKHYVVQQGDTNTMNGGNNPGIYITTQVPSVGAGGAAASVAAGSASPPVMPETLAEQSFLAAQGNSLAPSMGANVNTGKLLVIGAIATQAGITMAPCLGFTPGKKG